jgi:hypothetical protein
MTFAAAIEQIGRDLNPLLRQSKASDDLLYWLLVRKDAPMLREAVQQHGLTVRSATAFVIWPGCYQSYNLVTEIAVGSLPLAYAFVCPQGPVRVQM